MIRILFLGDIVGEPGRNAVVQFVPEFRESQNIDFVIVNGENAAGGRGITPKLAIDLLRCGVAVITMGDHVWNQKEIISFIDTEPRLLRPLNYPESTPGHGSIILDTVKGKIGVINLQGRTFMQPTLENPFRMGMAEVEHMRQETAIIFVDMHAEATSEKIAMGYYLDGFVSAVVGTHTHVQTADEKVLPKGTAFLSDAGMCGVQNSILGRESEPIISSFLHNMPVQFPIARGSVLLCGVLVDIDEYTGKALKIVRVSQWKKE